MYAVLQTKFVYIQKDMISVSINTYLIDGNAMYIVCFIMDLLCNGQNIDYSQRNETVRIT